ncbi:MAG TPA: EfeM/EfeO family lipoprotein [Polyangiaceae bacterium]|nr:EfeM/EfeO family lipoprotein [Polyangiaceae bacterium]
MKKLALLCLIPALGLAACSSDDAKPKTDADYETDVTQGMHDSLLTDIQALHQAALDIVSAAPSHAWDADADADAIQNMKSAWIEARTHYERTEGALAPLFPDIDTEIDARYDDFLATLGDQGDQDLFDDQGVTGMHAIERILYQPETPESVIELEETLPGYKAAAWPATDDEAVEFKTKLCQRLADDTATLEHDWTPQVIDLNESFQGLVSLMNEQREKVSKAATDEEESRYAQRTMADIRDNLAGTKAIYALFEPWLATKSGGPAIDGDVQNAFGELDTAYSQVSGDAIPQPPADWSSESPPPDALTTPFGELWSAVQNAVNPNVQGSAVDGMNRAAVELGFGQFVEGE